MKFPSFQDIFEYVVYTWKQYVPKLFQGYE